ncbi:MAG: phage holin [Butyricicoccus sp.]|nr:phage holin [Butyricicoccus sp.]
MNITKGTLARTIILALALINQILSVCGVAVLPIEDGQVETLVSTAWTVVAAVVAWWKNNSFTSAAIAADQVLKESKLGDSDKNL